MINYWWNTSPDFMDSPMNALLHGLLSLRGRSDAEKAAWRTIFDHYLVAPSKAAAGRIADHAQGPLGALDPVKARRLRAQILQKLNR